MPRLILWQHRAMFLLLVLSIPVILLSVGVGIYRRDISAWWGGLLVGGPILLSSVAFVILLNTHIRLMGLMWQKTDYLYAGPYLAILGVTPTHFLLSHPLVLAFTFWGATWSTLSFATHDIEILSAVWKLLLVNAVLSAGVLFYWTYCPLPVSFRVMLSYGIETHSHQPGKSDDYGLLFALAIIKMQLREAQKGHYLSLKHESPRGGKYENYASPISQFLTGFAGIIGIARSLSYSLSIVLILVSIGSSVLQFAAVYRALDISNPGSFSNLSGTEDAFFLSVSTLTTLGAFSGGPVSSVAKLSICLESLVSALILILSLFALSARTGDLYGLLQDRINLELKIIDHEAEREAKLNEKKPDANQNAST